MIEKDIKSRLKDKLELHNQKEVKKELKLVGQIMPHPGHFVFERDIKTGIIIRLDLKADAELTYKSVSVKKKVTINPNCQYLTALNMKSAKRKFNKI